MDAGARAAARAAIAALDAKELEAVSGGDGGGGGNNADDGATPIAEKKFTFGIPGGPKDAFDAGESDDDVEAEVNILEAISHL